MWNSTRASDEVRDPSEWHTTDFVARAVRHELRLSHRQLLNELEAQRSPPPEDLEEADSFWRAG